MVDPVKRASVTPLSDVAYTLGNQAATKPSPRPTQNLADGAVVSPPAGAVSLNPQPLPPKVIGPPAPDATVSKAGVALAALKDVSIESNLPAQISSIVGGILDKVALNPQPLPPKEIGRVVSDVLSKVGIIVVGGKSGPDGILPEDNTGRPGKAASQRLAQAGIIIVGGKTPGTKIAMPEEEEMPPPPPRGDRLSINLRSLSAQAMSQLIDESIQQVTARKRR